MPPTQPRFASAGNAGETTEAPPNPIGLYRQTDSRQPGYGTEIGVLDPIQGDAVVRQGFELVEEGREAAMKPQKAMDADAPKADEKSDQPKPGAK
jgi:hypothetical protein